MTQRPHCSHYALIICCDSRSSILASNKHSAGPSALPAWVILRVREVAMEKRKEERYAMLFVEIITRRGQGGRKNMGQNEYIKKL